MAVRLLLPVLLLAGAQPVAGADMIPIEDHALQIEASFNEYSPLATGEELLRRMLPPVMFDDVIQRAAHDGKTYAGQVVDLSQERFALYVPTRPPSPSGYALMVFVPPWDKAVVPPQWMPVLEKYGLIFVTAQNSGNTADILRRRNPLALLGAYNVIQRYPIDPTRIYIGGMSGGSRVALRLGLSYPELFRGVFLHSGSDPIGDLEAVLPSTDLFHQFQESTRLVYFTGQGDQVNLDKDNSSRLSLRQWCVFDSYAETMPFIAHELASAHDFEDAVLALQRHAAVDPDKLAQCRQRYQNDLAAKLQEVSVLIAQGKRREATRQLKKIDEGYGGLAAPQSVELARQLAAAR